MTTTKPKRLTTGQAAERLGVNRDRVRKLVKAGEFPGALNIAVRADGRPRFLIPVDDIDDFEQRRTVTAS